MMVPVKVRRRSPKKTQEFPKLGLEDIVKLLPQGGIIKELGELVLCQKSDNLTLIFGNKRSTALLRKLLREIKM